MKIYYLEFKNSVKFFRNDATVEIEKTKLLELFLKAVYKKYGKKVKFECLIQMKLKVWVYENDIADYYWDLIINFKKLLGGE